MWTLPFVLIVLLYLPRSLAGQEEKDVEEEAKDALLDIIHPDSSCIDVFTRRPYGTVQKIYTAKAGYRISSVLHGDAILWSSSGDYSCTHVTTLMRGHYTTHANVYLRDKEGQVSPLYFERDGSIWVPSAEEAFYSSFHKMVKSKTQTDQITLNIMGKNDPAFFYVNKSPKFPFAVYAANSACRIMRIMDGHTNVWNAQSEDEGCLYASFYPREDPIVAYLMVSSDHGTYELYYHRVGEEWISATRNEYKLGLYTNGFNESTFDNTIILDISNVDGEAFHQHSYVVSDYSDRQLTPLPGYLLTSVTAGTAEIWTAEDGEYCTYVDVYGKKHEAITLYLLVKDKEGGRRIVYHAKLDGTWKVIDKNLYYDILAGRNSPVYTHKGDGRIVMSSFRNRQGLKIITYASTVDNSRGDIILIHGIRGGFMVDFNSVNPEWIYKHYDFPVCSYANPFGGYKPPLESDHADMYRHLFENPGIPGEDVLQMSSIYKYKGGMIEFLNRMGYNVYGYDHQSYGLSEAPTEKRCFVKDFKDYVHDFLQFISIVRRGAFNDTSETWNESLIYKNVERDRKLILIGYSLGANIVMQATQEFHRHADSQGNSIAPIVDRFIGLSPMLSLENYMDTWVTSAKIGVLRVYAEICPTTTNTYDRLDKHGESFNNFSRYNDPFFFSGKLTLKTSKTMFDACDDVNKEENMAHYPKDLPTLFIHTKGDKACSINGPRKMMAKYFKGSQNAKFVELEGATHCLTLPYFMVVLQGHLKEWLDKYT